MAHRLVHELLKLVDHSERASEVQFLEDCFFVELILANTVPNVAPITRVHSLRRRIEDEDVSRIVRVLQDDANMVKVRLRERPGDVSHELIAAE